MNFHMQDEYLKAYYAALLQKQQEVEAAKRQQEMDVKSANDMGPSSSRQVGMKVKREEDGEEDVDWEESTAAGEFLIISSRKEKYLQRRISYYRVDNA